MQSEIKQFFKEVFEYNYEVNKDLIAAMEKLAGTVSEKSVRWMSHLLNAHHVWNRRIEKRSTLYGVWDLHNIGDLASINEDNYQDTLRILEDFELSDIISYKTSKGDPFSDTVRTILFQVINHYSYHRGQIATDFRQTGIEPLATDYIFYKRK